MEAHEEGKERQIGQKKDKYFHSHEWGMSLAQVFTFP